MAARLARPSSLAGSVVRIFDNVPDSEPEFVVYSRRGCHLCEILLEELEPLCRGRARIEVRDIDTRADWVDSFGQLVPIVFFGDEEVCRFHLQRQAVLNLLSRGHTP